MLLSVVEETVIEEAVIMPSKLGKMSLIQRKKAKLTNCDALSIYKEPFLR